MRITFDTSSLESYRQFLAVRRCPVYEFRGSDAIVPDEYAAAIFGNVVARPTDADYEPSPFLFDYQAGIARLAIRKRKFSVFADPGWGKTAIMLEFAQHVLKQIRMRPVLIVSPLMVVSQTVAESARFYPGLPITQIASGDVQNFLDHGMGVGVTNYEAFNHDLRQGRLGALILDESHMLAPHYGKWATAVLRLGQGLKWKLACTGTPAPNDRIDYANHAVFMDVAKTTNEFLATYFVNRGKTGERWELKPHAMERFYRDLSHWCIFMADPATYGWKDNVGTIPPIHVHIHRVDLSQEQRDAARDLTGRLFVAEVGGIGQRAKIGQIAKGKYDGKRIESFKPKFVRDLVDSWPTESTIVWCKYNDEQDQMAETFPEALSISGSTPIDKRIEMLDQFKRGDKRILISKSRVLGLGLNLQIATRHVFNGLHDSLVEYKQSVKRSNRVGSTKALNVHIPTTELEEPMIANVLRKAEMLEADTAIQ